MTDVSIVIVSYNTCRILRRCLEAALTYTDGLACEVIVVDNASADRSVEMVQTEFPHVRCIKMACNVGYAGGNNAGIRASQGEFVLLLNSDAFLSPGALRGMVEHLRCRDEIGIVGPRLAHEDGSLHLSCRHFPTLARYAAWVMSLHRFVRMRRVREYDWLTDFGHDEARRVDMLSGACWMLRRHMLNEIGLLNDRLFLYGEEFDLSWRAARGGWQTWFVPVGPVIHAGGKSSPGGRSFNAFTCFHRYRSGYLTMRWHRGKGQALAAAAMDQAVLAWRLIKTRVLYPDRVALLDVLRQTTRIARRAAAEMWAWQEEAKHVD